MISRLPQSRAGPSGKTEFEILKESHKFLREDAEENDSDWNDQLAAKYYASLYREFAVCDLKHYKSGNFALRWRSEEEVLTGAGESTCGNIRCDLHNLAEHLQSRGPSLTTLELPFAYEEHGEQKSALVKVVLCPKCLKKLMWKRRKEKEKTEEEPGSEEATKDVKSSNEGVEEQRSGHEGRLKESRSAEEKSSRDSGHRSERRRQHEDKGERRRRSSRSRSPHDRRRRHEKERGSDRH